MLATMAIVLGSALMALHVQWEPFLLFANAHERNPIDAKKHVGDQWSSEAEKRRYEAMETLLEARTAAIKEEMINAEADTILVLPNGDIAGHPLHLPVASGWDRILLNAYPNAWRVSLRNEDGLEVAYAERECRDEDAQCSVQAATGGCQRHIEYTRVTCAFSCHFCHDGDAQSDMVSFGGVLPSGSQRQLLYAVLDYFPWVWPAVPTKRNVEVGFDGATVALHTFSEAPRAFVAEGAVSTEERAAIIRLSQSRLRAVGWSRSETSIFNLTLANDITGDAALLQSVWLRMAALARIDPRSAEHMQVVRFRVGEHDHYRLSAGTREDPMLEIAGRAITVMLFLNEDFTGGETNLAVAGAPTKVRNFQEMLADFPSCQTALGLTVQPKAGDALLIYNLHPNTVEPDMRAWLASCDVGSGEKHVAHLWFSLGLEEALVSGRAPFNRRPGQSIFHFKNLGAEVDQHRTPFVQFQGLEVSGKTDD